jgi:hypothetical protein
MEPTLHFRAMAAFCRQRAKMDGEDDRFWLAEAETLAELAVNADRTMKAMQGRNFEKWFGVVE